MIECPVCGLLQPTAHDNNQPVSCSRCGWDFSPVLGTSEEARTVLGRRLQEARVAWQQHDRDPAAGAAQAPVQPQIPPTRPVPQGQRGTTAMPGNIPSTRPAPSRQAPKDPTPGNIEPTRPAEPRTPTAFGAGAGLGGSFTLAPDTYVGERYRVIRELGTGGGESEIFLCEDTGVPEDHRDRQVVLKLYRLDHQPKQEVLKPLLSLDHADLIRILDLGQWSGRAYEVLEYCRGGTMADAMPYQPAALLDALDQIVNGLDYCHAQGIVHRDIKPNNLLWRDAARTDLVLTDFGISSYLRKWQDGGGPDHTRTASAARLTPHYAAPELFSNDEIGFKTDWYSLGITLIHLLTGEQPFGGLRPDAVIVAHLHNRIPLPEGLDPMLHRLMQGLTQLDPKNRWGLTQIQQWQELRAGKRTAPVENDLGRPWQHQPYTGAIPPFQYCKSAANPVELARQLNRFDAARRLANGDIRRWIANFDEPLADRIEELESDVERNPRLAVETLGWFLDRTLPLHIEG